MIEINYTNLNGGVILERELTPEELNYSSKLVKADTVQFFYGDEPPELLPGKQTDTTQPGADLSQIDINSLTDDQLTILKKRLNKIK